MVPILALVFIILFIISLVPIIPLMADETIQGTKGWQAVQRGGPVPRQDQLSVVRVNGTTTTLGMVVTHTGETFPDVAPAVTTDRQFAGVVLDVQNLKSILDLDPDWDMDDTIPDNQQIIIAKRGSGLVVAMILTALAGPVALVKGDRVALSAGVGQVRKHLYVDATEATDTMGEVVGSIQEATAGDTGDDLIILVRLDQ